MPLTRRELLGVLLAATAVMALTCVPFLVVAQPGYAGPDLHFMGLIWGVDDGNVYLSQIRQYAQGRLFAADQYTTLPQTPRYLNLLWFTLGQVQRLTGLPSILLYHLARLLGGIALLYLIYLLAAQVGLSHRGRILAFLLSCLSSGLGWIVYLAVHSGVLTYAQGEALGPIDTGAGWMLMPEAHTSMTLLFHPHFIVGVALMCGTYLWALRAAVAPGLRPAVLAGFCLLLLGNIHTYDTLTVCPVLGLWFLLLALRGRLPWLRAAGRYALILGVGLPTTLWQYYLLQSDPTWAAKGATPTLSPPLTGYLLGYGLIFALALAAAVYAVRAAFFRREHEGSDAFLLLVIWAGLSLALAYLPVAFQRKLIEGLDVALCLLAAWLVAQVWGRRLSRSSFAVASFALVALSVPSNLFVVADGLAGMRANSRLMISYLLPPNYLTSGELAALDWLAVHTTERDAVLASKLFAVYIPAHAPCRVVSGHWGETVDFLRLNREVMAFYDPDTPPPLRRELLRSLGANLVVYGPEERVMQIVMARDLRAARDPAAELPELHPAYTGPDLTIYRVSVPPTGNPEPYSVPRRP